MAGATGLSTVADKGSDMARRTRDGCARQASDAVGRTRRMPRAVRIVLLAALASIAAAVVRRLTSGTGAQDGGGATDNSGDVSAQAPQTPQPPSEAPDPAEYASPPAAPPRADDNLGEGAPGPPNQFPSQSGGTAA